MQKEMEEYQVFYSKIILKKDHEMDLNNTSERGVRLEIDVAYTLGKSVAVLHNDNVVGHLPRWAAKPVWRHLQRNGKLEGTIYDELDNGFKNKLCFSTITKSEEIGIQIRFYYHDYVDGNQCISGNSQATMILAYVMKHHLNSFPGVTVSNCPPELRYLLF